uniref:TMEM165/GDT1 family protein n=1 Tax=uncultured Jatrophihabitans sp. TaxID=1610747 RepID=UPI0035CB0AD5
MSAAVRLVVVSHSTALADGVVELARQMAPDVDLVAAGGTDDGGLGTSFDRITAALDAPPTGGVVVLYDLGSALLISFGVIFVAELGDKSQLMAMTFATRYRALPVLIGISVATSVVHAVSVGVGFGLGAALPTGWISLLAAVAFLGFGAWTLRGDSLSEAEQNKASLSTRSAVIAVPHRGVLGEDRDAL